MIDLYENEIAKVYDTVQTVQTKYQHKQANGEVLLQLQQELVGRLADLGFGATVDVTPILEGQPCTVRIDSRLDGDPFDAERKRWEVKRRIERKDASRADDIEGTV